MLTNRRFVELMSFPPVAEQRREVVEAVHTHSVRNFWGRRSWSIGYVVFVTELVACDSRCIDFSAPCTACGIRGQKNCLSQVRGLSSVQLVVTAEGRRECFFVPLPCSSCHLSFRVCSPIYLPVQLATWSASHPDHSCQTDSLASYVCRHLTRVF